MKSIKFPNENIKVHGLAWFYDKGEDKGKLSRLPGRLEWQLNKEFWRRSTELSGARLRFRSDTGTIVIKADYLFDHEGANRSLISRCGFDVYADGQFWNVKSRKPEENFIDEKLFYDAPRQMREFEIYFPKDSAIDLHEIQIDDDAVILPPEKNYLYPKPVFFYGTSITQGRCSSRPGTTYQAIISRKHNIDFINLGFAGRGRGEACIAREMAQKEAVCYVLDFSQNNYCPEHLADVYYPFIREIKNVKPDTPMILISAYWDVHETHDKEIVKLNTDLRRVVSDTYKRCIDEGMKEIYYVDGLSLLKPYENECFSDMVHPNDLGYFNIAERLWPVLLEII